MDVLTRRERPLVPPAWAKPLGLGLGYFALAWLGTRTVEESVGFEAIWPAAGLLVGVLLLSPGRRWPALLAAAAAASLAAYLLSGMALDTSIGFTAVNCLEGVAAALVAGQLASGRALLGSVRGAFALFGGAALLANAATAALGAAVAARTLGSDFGAAWAFWFAADGVGVVAVTPLVLLAAGLRGRWRLPPRATLVEAALALTTLAAVSIYVFSSSQYESGVFAPRTFMILPFVVWPALRLGAAGTAVAVSLIAIVASAGTLAGSGPIAATGSDAVRMLHLQVFVAVLGGTGMLIAASLGERAAAITRLGAERAFGRAMVEEMAEGVIACDSDGRLIVFNEEARRIHGVEQAGAGDFTDVGSERWSLHHDVTDPVTGEAVAVDELPMVRALRGERTRNAHLRITPQGLPGREVNVSAEPIEGPGGEVLGAVLAIRDETARRGEERERERERAQLAEAERIARVGSWEWDIEANLVSYSAQHYRNLGLQPRPGTVEPSIERAMVHPDDRRRVDELMASIRAQPREYAVEYRVVRPDDGSVATMHGHGVPYRGEDGSVRMRGSTRDVTAERRAEAALRESELRFRSLATAAPVGIYETDREGRLTFANHRIGEIAGIDATRLLGYGWRGSIHPDERDEERRMFGAAVREGREVKHDYRLLRPDGGTVWVSEHSIALRNTDGAIRGYLGTVTDITEEKRAREALAEAEERFRGAFEHSGIGMALVAAESASGRFEAVNDALCDLTGYSRDQLLSMRSLDLFHPDHVTAMREGATMLIRGETDVYQAEHRLIGANGRQCWVALTSALVRDAAGRPLHRSIQYQDVTERKRFEGQLQHLADHDPLTGLFNRRRFEQELGREVAAAHRYGSSGAVLMLDLDNFKYVNDSLGHSAGDELLISTARALRERLRITDTLARLGGDEFGVIIARAGLEQARAVASELCAVVREQVRIEGASGPRRVTASAGVAMFGDAPDGPEQTSDDLVVEADIAMYDAKEAGRDTFAVYDRAAERRARLEARATWVDRVREALAEDRFTLHAQPIMPLQPGDERPRFELLIRMLDRDGDLVPPGTFLFIAERFGLIGEIDRWVVREAIELLGDEERTGSRCVFEINLSAKSLDAPGLLELISERLRETGADPSRLVFEVTETEAIVNVDRAREFSERVRDLGCGFALDDFGAGFASFYYLKHLGFDYLKIDGEFIEDLPRNRTDQMVVRAVVEIAQGLGKRTVAEFVGDRATVRLLRELGVDYAQGFFIGEPQPLDRIDLTRRATLGS